MNPGAPNLCRITVASANPTRWGGSEELWSATSAALARRGHAVSVWKPRIDDTVGRIRDLRALGVPLHDPRSRYLWQIRAWTLLRRIFPRLERREVVHFRRMLRKERCEFLVISQGGNFDGAYLAQVARELSIPYALVSHKADEIHWPPDNLRRTMREAHMSAIATYFVSNHNHRLSEEQIGTVLPHAQIVRNPFQVPWAPREDWPNQAEGMRMACIGRLDILEKGQDLVLRMLAMDKWRSRAMRVCFFGVGDNAVGLQEMAQLLKLESVEFAGFCSSPEHIWDDHHALILPSRCEGLPLVEVEAMLSGRVVVTTAAGGNAEILADDETGFLAPAVTLAGLDAAMERAWARRGDWRQIGHAASIAIRHLVPADPAEKFADEIVRCAEAATVAQARSVRRASGYARQRQAA
jgi:glycosyltransferase involved in cell wall biosynthesis